jgi:hypothetical protein
MRFLILSAAIAFTLLSCVAPERARSSPAPLPKAINAALPPVLAAAAPQSGPWLDWPLAQGSWTYRGDEQGSIASYGPPGSAALVTMRCDKRRGVIALVRAGLTANGAANGLTVRTSSALKTGMTTNIAPNDPILDAMAYSRGRIAIEAGGLQSIAIPVWSEIGRVIEDCRA